MVNHDPGGQEGTLTGPMLIKELSKKQHLNNSSQELIERILLGKIEQNRINISYIKFNIDSKNLISYIIGMTDLKSDYCIKCQFEAKCANE